MASSIELTDDGTQEEEFWRVIWFPPDGDRQRRCKSEDKAQRFAAHEDVARWNPLIEHVIIVSMTTSEIIPLEPLKEQADG